MKKRLDFKSIIISIIALASLIYLFFYVKDIIKDIFVLQKNDDLEHINDVLGDKGIFGYLSIILIEAMQMIVVFISTTFIQLAAGLAYPWYIAVPLCIAGVFVGSTIIFLLVRMFNFQPKVLKGTEDKINDKLQEINRKKQHGSIQTVMYLMFIAPIIPLGAIAYYGATSKISYRRYILTCTTGCIPDILVATVFSTIVRILLLNDMPFIYTLLIGLALIIVVGLGVIIVVRRMYFKEHQYTPDSIYYNILYKLFSFICKFKTTASFEKNGIDEIEGPYVLLSNHGSFFDVYYASTLGAPRRYAFILNRYYFRNKTYRKYLYKTGVIPKKLFSPDIETIKGILKSTKAGYPIYMCPEGRLSADGTNYRVTNETGKLVKQLKLPVAIATINGAYLVNPKWRHRRIKGHIHTKVNRIITKEELDTLSIEEVNKIINENIAYNDFEYAKENHYVYKNKKKAVGLHNLLYHCPKCHEEFKLSTKGNTITCDHCGFSVSLLKDYSFSENEFNFENIHDWYKFITDYEIENTIKTNKTIETDVIIKALSLESPKLDKVGFGVCTLNNDKFTFKGMVDNSELDFAINTADIKGLAFSAGEEFELYNGNILYYFYPVNNKAQCAKWALIVDEVVKLSEQNE